MKKFLTGILYFFCPPFFLMTGLYIKSDVYMDFGKYENYSWKYYYQSLGDISTKKLLSSSVKYNSFIFGSSRATSLYACYLQKEIPNSAFFHYANWSEPIGGIYDKIKLLDSMGYKLDNVFVYLDTDYSFFNEGKGQKEHYLLANENKYVCYLKHYKTFFFSTLDFNKLKILFGFRPDLESFPNSKSDKETNDPFHVCSDSVINSYGNSPFTKLYLHRMDSLKKTGFFYSRPKSEIVKDPQVSLGEKAIMKKIREIFNKHHTKYYIIITPLYDQMKFNSSDRQAINEFFGKKNVFDFSGINEITSNEYNYHDLKHFQPYVSKNMVDSILKND
jgi:hypothetical protein